MKRGIRDSPEIPTERNSNVSTPLGYWRVAGSRCVLRLHSDLHSQRERLNETMRPELTRSYTRSLLSFRQEPVRHMQTYTTCQTAGFKLVSVHLLCSEHKPEGNWWLSTSFLRVVSAARCNYKLAAGFSITASHYTRSQTCVMTLKKKKAKLLRRHGNDTLTTR